MSLVFGNAASNGNGLPVSDATPVDPYLELTAGAGRIRLEILCQGVGSALWPEMAGHLYRFRKFRVATEPPACLDADNQPVGVTPAEIGPS